MVILKKHHKRKLMSKRRFLGVNEWRVNELAGDRVGGQGELGNCPPVRLPLVHPIVNPIERCRNVNLYHIPVDIFLCKC